MASSKTPGYVTISSLPADRQAACHAAIATSDRAYCPYSKFSVGAALVHADGTVTAGANWENCTFQVTCAERCAIVAANAQGKRAATCCAIYGRVSGSTVNPKDFTVTAPCGLCRQMLNEVGELSHVDMDILLVTHSQTHVRMVKLSTLLPLAFGPSDCGLDISAFVPPPPSAAAASPSKSAAAEASRPKVEARNAKKKAASAAPKPAASAATKKRK